MSIELDFIEHEPVRTPNLLSGEKRNDLRVCAFVL